MRLYCENVPNVRRESRLDNGPFSWYLFRHELGVRLRQAIITSFVWPAYNPYPHTWKAAQDIAMPIRGKVADRLMSFLPLQHLINLRRVSTDWKRAADRALRECTEHLTLTNFPLSAKFDRGAILEGHNFISQFAPKCTALPVLIKGKSPTWKRGSCGLRFRPYHRTEVDVTMPSSLS